MNEAAIDMEKMERTGRSWIGVLMDLEISIPYTRGLLGHFYGLRGKCT